MKMPGYVLREFARISYNTVRRGAAHLKNSLIDKAPKLLILAYHRVLPYAGRDRLRIVVSTKAFMKQIDALADIYNIVSLSDALKRRGNVSSPEKDLAVLTFDDGYRDNYEIVFPILKKKGLSAVFFLTTDYVDGKAVYTDKRLLDPKTGGVRNYVKDRSLSWEEARKMANAGMEMGAHGVTHNSLAQMAQGEAESEITRSKNIIELNTGRPCRYFAFPFGSRSDYTDLLVDCVRGAGFEACFLNIHGYNHLHGGNFCLKRIIMEEAGSVSCLLG